MVGLADQPEFVSSNAGKEFLTVSAQQSTSCSFVRDLAALAPMLRGSRWSERLRLFGSLRPAKLSTDRWLRLSENPEIA
jgi:hypothetical protein